MAPIRFFWFGITHTGATMFLDLPLERAPRVIWMGMGLHGDLKVEKFLLPESWCLHLFRDPMDLRVNGQKIEVVPGTITLIPPNSPIEFHFPRRMRHLHAFAHFGIEPGQAQPFPAVQRLSENFEEHFAALSEAVGFWSNYPHRARARLWNVLWSLSHSAARVVPEDTLVARAREQIELRLGEPLRVSALACELGVSHNHLTRRFKAESGQTVVSFIRARRVQRAVYLLEGTTLPIKAVAASCGLGDFHLLNKTLRREIGRAPRSFRSGT